MDALPWRGSGVMAALHLADPATEAEWEFEISNSGWRWAPHLHDILAISPDCKPATRTLMAAKHPDDRPITRRMIAGAVAGHSFCYRSRIVRGDGFLRLVESRCEPASAADGTTLALNGRVASVTDWQQPVFENPDTTYASDGDLEVALLAHIQEAHTYAFRRYASDVAGIARRNLCGRTLCDDVVQSVFECLWSHPERYDSTRGSLGVYLKLQASGRSLDLMRSESSRWRRGQRYA